MHLNHNSLCQQFQSLSSQARASTDHLRFTISSESPKPVNILLSVFALENYSLFLYGASFEEFMNVIITCLISSLIGCKCWEFLNALTRLIAFHSIESVVRQIKTNALPQVEQM